MSKFKSGEELLLKCIIAPTGDYHRLISEFYGHKPPLWGEDLEKRLGWLQIGIDCWHLGLLKDKIVSGIQFAYSHKNPRIGAIDHV